MYQNTYNFTQCYIAGRWQAVNNPRILSVVDPATETYIGEINLVGEQQANDAVLAAKEAFASFSETSKQQRIELLEKVIALYKKRMPELAKAVSLEMGAPRWLAEGAQVASGLAHLEHTLAALQEKSFEKTMGNSLLRYEAVGVCALITPWNWPLNQIACKVAPALAAGCTMVLKPSEIAPLSAYLFTQILHDAGVPAGVFNLINGDGPGIGSFLSSHPDIDMVSFTGSTRAGVAVAKNAADTVKRVSQELGGKSGNILLPDVDINIAAKDAVSACMHNTGQSCNAPTRLFVHRSQYEMAVEVAATQANETKVGGQFEDETCMGPVISETQYQRIQAMIKLGIDEGARLVAGGLGKPEGLENGYFVKPTVFADVSHDMRIATDEIFGPVLVIIPYDTVQEAIAMANDTEYGLSGYVTSNDIDAAMKVVRQLRCGMVHINGAWTDPAMPFGGYKQSGNGREWGEFGLDEFLEVKAVMFPLPEPGTQTQTQTQQGAES